MSLFFFLNYSFCYSIYSWCFQPLHNPSITYSLANFNPELEERMGGLRTELESFENEDSVESHKQKAVDALKQMESWNLFSDISYEVYDII